VTVLFADLVDSTPLAERLDPEDVKGAVERCLWRLTREVEDFGGEVHQYMGDGLMAVFGAPVAHEDDPERAVRAGLAMQAAMAEVGELPLAGSSESLALRVGINSGEVMAGAFADHYNVIGDAVNVAARLEGKARPGGVVVGEGTFHSTRRAIEYRALGPVRLKGKSRAIRVWEAVAALSRTTPFRAKAPGEAPLIGRDGLLSTLTDILEAVVTHRRPEYVTLSGDPGVGKSRLVREFAAGISRLRPNLAVRYGRCLPYGHGVTFWALGEIVKAHCGIHESDSPESAGQRLTAALDSLVADDREREWMRARIRPLIGASGASPMVEAEPIETFAAWRRFLEVIAADRPLLLVIEDLHWANAGLLEFLAYLAESVHDLPLLGVATCRAEGNRHGWERRSGTVALPLEPLEHHDIELLIDGVLGGRPLRRDMRTAISKRAGGNPLFTEELVRMAVERSSAGSGSEAELNEQSTLVPDTVQAVMSSRLDTLSDAERLVLHDAAVIGERFWVGAVARLADADPEAVRPVLEDLAARGFIRTKPQSVVRNEEEFVFWHILLRDVAYQRLPRSARAVKHRAAASWIEEMAGNRAGDHAEMLASHFSAALSLSQSIPGVPVQQLHNDAARALSYTVEAAERATRLHAHGEAARHYAQAVRALDLLDPIDAGRRCELIVARGEAERRAGRVEDAKRTLCQGAELAMDLDASVMLARAALAFGGPSVRMGQLDRRVVALLDAALSRLGDDAPALRARVLARLAMELYFGGPPAQRDALIAEAMACARRAGDPAALAFVLGASHWTLWGPENPEQRLGLATELVQLGESLDERELTLQGHHWRLTDLLEIGDIAAADQELEAHAHLAHELRQPYYLWQTQLRRALRAQMSGDFDDAERLAQQAWEMGREVDPETAAGYLLAVRLALAREGGDLEQLEPEVSRGVEEFPTQPAWRAMRAWIHEGCGELRTAARDLETVARDDFATLPRDYRWMGAIAMLAEVAVTLRDRPRAAALYQALSPFAARNVLFGRAAVVFGSAARYLGLLATVLGRWEEAEGHLARALATNTAMQAWPSVAHTHLALARLAIARAGMDAAGEAADHVASALAIAERLHMHRVGEIARALGPGSVPTNRQERTASGGR
jgi:class 3 adenylate cyclase/tetratricopeptide (TPR) repeat protein